MIIPVLVVIITIIIIIIIIINIIRNDEWLKLVVNWQLAEKLVVHW